MDAQICLFRRGKIITLSPNCCWKLYLLYNLRRNLLVLLFTVTLPICTSSFQVEKSCLNIGVSAPSINLVTWVQVGYSLAWTNSLKTVSESNRNKVRKKRVFTRYFYKNTWLRFQPACFLLLGWFFTTLSSLTLSKNLFKVPPGQGLHAGKLCFGIDHVVSDMAEKVAQVWAWCF